MNKECLADEVPHAANLLVAFASDKGEIVDQHFGSSLGFFVYDISAKGASLITSKRFASEKMDGNEDKLKGKLSWLNGADVVYCGSIGGSASRQLFALDITPVRVNGQSNIKELISGLRAQLDGIPEFWLENILRRKEKRCSQSDRFEIDDEQSWD